jgi:hypothetical protein
VPLARNRLVVLASVSAAVVLCILFVDRPLALWLDERFRGTTVFAVALAIFRPMDTVALLAAALLVFAIGWKRFYAVPEWVNRFIAGGVAVALSLLGAIILKRAFGRSDVFPPFLRDHIYTFRLFAGSNDFTAFPSATMSGAAAFAAGVGPNRGYQRVLATIVLATLALAILITSSHWLGDVIAGAYLGTLIGALTATRLLRPRAPARAPAAPPAGQPPRSPS